MDGPHDLGGREGFGPIDVQTEYEAFAEPWEGRMWAIDMNVGPEGSTIDWFRHRIERLDPAMYLTFPYFEKWAMGAFAGFVMTGEFTEQEVLFGRTGRRGDPPPPVSAAEVVADSPSLHRSFAKDPDAQPVFAVGDRVRSRSHGVPGHTRLPAYARGRVGEVIAQRGGQIFPDEAVDGVIRGEHLYTVAFAARELWGEGASPRDSVRLDLWESYLVPA